MTIRVPCACGKVLSAPDAAVGKKGRCPACGREVVVSGTPAPAAAAPEAAPEPGRKSVRVLIADPVKTDQDALAQVFKERGYQVIHVTSSSEGVVSKVRELKPDVAVVDVKLDGTSGFHAIRLLTDPLNPLNKDVDKTLFVMTTPDLHGRDKQYALSLGVEIFLEKPCAPARLFPRIERRLKKP